MNPRELLGDEVAATLSALGAEPVDASLVTGLRQRGSDRATFRIALADGRALKARRAVRPSRGPRAAALLDALADPHFPPLLVVAGRITIEAWVDGTPVSELPLTRSRIDRAADILGRLHATHALNGRRLVARRSARPVLDRAETQLVRMSDDGMLHHEEARQLIDALHDHAPARAIRGVTHNDFCAENLVERADGELVAVDNEGMRTGFLDFDLARTRYRWPMADPSWQRFLGRYTPWRDEPLSTEHEPFWRIAAVVKSAHVRRRRRAEASGLPLEALRRLLDDLD